MTWTPCKKILNHGKTNGRCHSTLLNVQPCSFQRKENHSPETTFCKQTLHQSSSQPYLEVQLDSKLSWREPADNITAKANQTLGFLRRTWFYPQEIKTMAHFTLVRLILEYASCTWDPHKIGQENRLEGIQRRAACFV